MSIQKLIKIKNNALPNSPGVYLMKNIKNRVIYVGKASSLKKRVNSYFVGTRGDAKTALLVSDIKKIDYQLTDSILEATILEPQLIRKHQPKYNIKLKDDKSFLYIVITREKFPKIEIIRGQELKQIDQKKFKAIFGPFTNHQLVKFLLKRLRKIFPYCNQGRGTSSCFYYHLKLCPGVCTGEISQTDYQKIIRNFILFFQGKKKSVIKNFERQMRELAKQEQFEQAMQIRNQLFYLKHIQDFNLILKDDVLSPKFFKRIEGYDISNISGTSATGSMVVFEQGEPNKSQYRRFKIKTVKGSNDIAMLKEVIQRRLRHTEWPRPDLILVDGGQAQVNAVVDVLSRQKRPISIIGLAKGSNRKKNELIFGPMITTRKQIIYQNHKLLIRVRDEAHRFALGYHRKLRRRRAI